MIESFAEIVRHGVVEKQTKRTVRILLAVICGLIGVNCSVSDFRGRSNGADMWYHAGITECPEF